jgi:hypothetical protein
MAEVARILVGVVEDRGLYATISGRRHLLVTAWTTLGGMLGVFPVITWTRPNETGDGYVARCEARTRDGALVGAAESECSRSESTWRSRDAYALRSMAQTRATGRALRGPLEQIVVLAGFDPNAAEEMPPEPAPLPRPAVWTKRPAPDAPRVDELASTEQLRRLVTLMRDAGLAEPPAMLAYASRVTGREIASSKELTSVEASSVMRALVETRELLGEPELPAITKLQLRKIQTLFREVGITDRKARLVFCENIIARPLKSSNDLTMDEASRIIEVLEQLREDAAAGSPTGAPEVPAAASDSPASTGTGETGQAEDAAPGGTVPTVTEQASAASFQAHLDHENTAQIQLDADLRVQAMSHALFALSPADRNDLKGLIVDAKLARRFEDVTAVFLAEAFQDLEPTPQALLALRNQLAEAQR